MNSWEAGVGGDGRDEEEEGGGEQQEHDDLRPEDVTRILDGRRKWQEETNGEEKTRERGKNVCEKIVQTLRNVAVWNAAQWASARWRGERGTLEDVLRLLN